MTPRTPAALLALAGLTVAPLALAGDMYRADQTPGTAEAVAAGKAQFMMCAGCHGMEGEDKIGIAPRLNSPNHLAVTSNDFLRETLVNGRPGTNMAPFGAGMQPEQVDALGRCCMNRM